MTIRLNKVARDLNVGIATAVDFLQKKGYSVEANPNTKITEEQYAELVKEFNKDKDLKIKSEKIIQERQNKEKNKASVSIDDIADDVVKAETVAAEEVRQKFKPIGKIDLDSLNKRKSKPSMPEPTKNEAGNSVETENIVKEEVKAEPVVETVKKEEPQEQKPVVIEEKETKQKDANADEVTNKPMEEKKEEAEKLVNDLKNDDKVFKIRPTEFKSKINVVGQIDLAALNQSTRPKKKSKEEKRKEREEKDKMRQEQRKQMKDAIIKEIRKSDEKSEKGGQDDGSKKKKRNRINKERVDIYSTQAAQPHGANPKGEKSGKNQGGGKNAGKDKFKKPVVKQEVSDEDVAKQVNVLQIKVKIKLLNTVRRNVKVSRTVRWSRKNLKWKKAKYLNLQSSLLQMSLPT